MIEGAQRQLIADAARDLVAQMAPQELPRFRAVSEVYFEDPARALEGAEKREEDLGFGTGLELVFLTPVVLSVITQVVAFLSEQLSKSLSAGSAAAATELVRGAFKRFQPADPAQHTAAPSLSHEEVVKVRALAYTEARRLNLSESRANLLADSVAGSLAVASA